MRTRLGMMRVERDHTLSGVQEPDVWVVVYPAWPRSDIHDAEAEQVLGAVDSLDTGLRHLQIAVGAARRVEVRWAG